MGLLMGSCYKRLPYFFCVLSQMVSRAPPSVPFNGPIGTDRLGIPKHHLETRVAQETLHLLQSGTGQKSLRGECMAQGVC